VTKKSKAGMRGKQETGRKDEEESYHCGKTTDMARIVSFFSGRDGMRPVNWLGEAKHSEEGI